MTALCQGPDPNTRTPRLAMPPGACDTHCHVFGPASEYPYAEDRSYTPPDALLEDYLRMAETLGIERAVIVQASVQGTDNAPTLDALARMGGRFAASPWRRPTSATRSWSGSTGAGYGACG